MGVWLCCWRFVSACLHTFMHVASLTPDPVLMRRFSRLAQVPHPSHATEHWQMAVVSSFNLSEQGHKSYRQFHRNESPESERDFPLPQLVRHTRKLHSFPGKQLFLSKRENREWKVSDVHLHIEMVNMQRDSVNFSFALPDERGGLCKSCRTAALQDSQVLAFFSCWVLLQFACLLFSA